jgi:hypothetical protein
MTSPLKLVSDIRPDLPQAIILEQEIPNRLMDELNDCNFCLADFRQSLGGIQDEPLDYGRGGKLRIPRARELRFYDGKDSKV